MVKKNSQEDLVRQLASEVEGTVDEHYSGRGMYGKECMGVDCDDADDCLMVAGRLGLKGARTDSLGRGYIVYFPTIQSSRVDED